MQRLAKEKRYEQAVSCVKDVILPMQREIYEKCGGDFDKIYGEAMNSDLYTGKVIESGHIYELGYHKCTCPKVLSGEVTNPEHCRFKITKKLDNFQWGVSC